MKSFIKENSVSLLFIAFTAGLGLALRSRLPILLPSHYGVTGAPDHYLPALQVIFLLPGISLLLVLMLPLLMRVSPPGFQMPESRRGLARVNFAIVLMLSIVQVGILLSQLPDSRFTPPPFFCAAFGAGFLVLGNFFGKLERNFFVGIRTPWTLASEQNWLATHRFAGKLMVGTGMVLLALSLMGSTLVVALVLIVVASLLPVGYSFWFYRTRENHQR